MLHKVSGHNKVIRNIRLYYLMAKAKTFMFPVLILICIANLLIHRQRTNFEFGNPNGAIWNAISEMGKIEVLNIIQTNPDLTFRSYN